MASAAGTAAAGAGQQFGRRAADSIPQRVYWYLDYRINRFRDWYNTLSIGNKTMWWGCTGQLIGIGLGTKYRLEGERYKSCDCLTLVSYEVREENAKAFEQLWNDQARLCQRQLGYEWTTMHKTLAWNRSPFTYMAFRMWSEDEHYLDVLKHDRTYGELESRMKEVGVRERHSKYETIVDDSIQRWIR